MTWRRMLALSKHWRQYPPVHVSLAAFLFGNGAAPEAKPDRKTTGEEVMAFLGQSGGRINILDP